VREAARNLLSADPVLGEVDLQWSGVSVSWRQLAVGADNRNVCRGQPGTGQVSAVARELAGWAGARLLPALGIMASRHTALRVLLHSAARDCRAPGAGY
jgi:hypothetical protein